MEILKTLEYLDMVVLEALRLVSNLKFEAGRCQGDVDPAERWEGCQVG